MESFSYVNMECALTDHGRLNRCGFPEVILSENKTPEQLLQIVENYFERSLPLFMTRLTLDQMNLIQRTKPDIRLNKLARTGTWRIGKENSSSKRGELVICCAGTSDFAVAEEVRETALFFGREPVMINDVGVAGIHRLLSHRDTLERAKVLVVVAGMEGALPSVVAGLVRACVIAVPSSVGYGVAQGGVAALLGMLSSCSSGITVVNIDNGFGAACAAERILSNTLYEQCESSPFQR
jgi:NCAIR mutase (PurE)-related protein